jgi:hypothetical protein
MQYKSSPFYALTTVSETIMKRLLVQTLEIIIKIGNITNPFHYKS